MVEEFTRYLFDHARDIVLVIETANGNIVDANRAAESAYRYPRPELLARRIFDLRVDGQDDVSRQMAVARADGIMFETVHRRADGTTFPVEVSSFAHATGQRLFSIVRDISERMRLEHERAELLATTRRALETRDEFLQIASHELRGPIANVSLQLQHLRRSLQRGADPSQLDDGLRAALRESERLDGIVTSMLDARLVQQPAASELNLTEIDLAHAVTDAIEHAQPRALQAGSDLRVDVCSIRGRWDRRQLDQLLSNLLSNAIKYGRGKPVDIIVRAEDDHATIEVRDHGIGIRSEDRERIFGRFERATHAVAGLGLGLYIARAAAIAHGGSLEVESIPEVGSTFRARLPRDVAPSVMSS